MQLHYIAVTAFSSVDRFIFGSNFPSVERDSHGIAMSSHTKLFDVTASRPELPFFHKRKGILKLDQSLKMP